MHAQKRILVVGAGVAGAEMGTYLGEHARSPIEIVEIEREPSRRFGGWAFQSFPGDVTTNLAIRKMALGEDSDEILRWIEDPEVREQWPTEFREIELNPEKPMPRVLFREYVRWRRSRVQNPLVTYTTIVGEAMRVAIVDDHVEVTLDSGEIVVGDQVVMASGSISVKVPSSIEAYREHRRIVIDPLTREGHDRRAMIEAGSKVLVLGTGLTGEEQVMILLQHGVTDLTLYSRHGSMHYAYPELQRPTEPLVLTEPPAFLMAETPEEFDEQLLAFFERYLAQGYVHEDILGAVRPMWNDIRKQLGGCVRAADRLREHRRLLAVNSIGTTHEMSVLLREAHASGFLEVRSGEIETVEWQDGSFEVAFRAENEEGSQRQTKRFDWIINAVGRNIVRHPIWDDLFASGLAKKHAGIGVQVDEYGRMLDASGIPSTHIWVVGMPRAGDHTLRRGYLGNFAFNVPQVRAHVYAPAQALLDSL